MLTRVTQLYNKENSGLYCYICSYVGPSSRDVQRHTSRMHPEVADYNWPLGDRRHRYAPSGTAFCHSCQVFIGAFNGEMHKLNARHNYLCRNADSAAQNTTADDFDAADGFDIDKVFDPDENIVETPHDFDDSTHIPFFETLESDVSFNINTDDTGIILCF